MKDREDSRRFKKVQEGSSKRFIKIQREGSRRFRKDQVGSTMFKTVPSSKSFIKNIWRK